METRAPTHSGAALRRGEEAALPQKLLETPGYLHPLPVTSPPARTHSALTVWRESNGRADGGNAIRDLDHGSGLVGFCCHRFRAAEAPLSTVVPASNLITLFERKLGWTPRATARSLRYWIFTSPGVVVRGAARTVLQPTVPPASKDWSERSENKSPRRSPTAMQ